MNPTMYIGMVAHNEEKTEILCHGDTCLVFGNEQSYADYVKSYRVEKNRIFAKVRLYEIIEVLKEGGAYLLDEEAYTRFNSNDLGAQVAIETTEVFIPTRFFVIEAVFPEI